MVRDLSAQYTSLWQQSGCDSLKSSALIHIYIILGKPKNVFYFLTLGSSGINVPSAWREPGSGSRAADLEVF